MTMEKIVCPVCNFELPIFRDIRDGNVYQRIQNHIQTHTLREIIDSLEGNMIKQYLKVKPN